MNGRNSAYDAAVMKWVCDPAFVRASFAGVKRIGRAGPLERVVVRGVDLREGRRLQVSRFVGKKDVTTNYGVEEAEAGLADVLAAGFANVHVLMEGEEVDVRLSKKGEVFEGRRKREGGGQEAEGARGHNRVKEVPLPEGKSDRFLEAMGVVDRAGRVRPSMRGKFTQINEFLKLLGHGVGQMEGGGTGGMPSGATGAQEDARADGSPQGTAPGKRRMTPGESRGSEELVILDCGCGASYLTLATWHFLNEVKGVRARVMGVDVNEEVVEKARARARELGCESGTEFRVGKIGALEEVRADIVLALHACDTATDDALAQGVKSGARLLMAAPCCHKELHRRLRVAGLEPLQRHGILHERFADGVTDAFRALLLKVMGYRTEVIEFISPEHTARNLMIRAVKVRAAGDAEALVEYRRFAAFVGVRPYLAGILGIN